MAKYRVIEKAFIGGRIVDPNAFRRVDDPVTGVPTLVRDDVVEHAGEPGPHMIPHIVNGVEDADARSAYDAMMDKMRREGRISPNDPHFTSRMVQHTNDGSPTNGVINASLLPEQRGPGAPTMPLGVAEAIRSQLLVENDTAQKRIAELEAQLAKADSRHSETEAKLASAQADRDQALELAAANSQSDDKGDAQAPSKRK